MVEDPLRDIIDGVRARLQDELETQLRAVSERHQQALAEARQRIEADAEERCAGRLESATAELEAVRTETDARIDTAVAAARGEMEEQARGQMEAQAARARQEMEQTLAHERQLAQSTLDAARHQATEQLADARESFEAERRTSVVSAGTTAPSAGALSQQADSLVRGLHGIAAAGSVSDALAAMARAAAAEAPRAALFLTNGTQLEEWPVDGLPRVSSGSLNMHDSEAGLVVQALAKGHAVRNNGSACAVPLLLDGTPVGVLYGEVEADGENTAAWPDSLEVVARFGAAHLGYLTALRTAQARQWLASSSAAATDETAVASARRYARLVVSEIKLYNEAAVQTGRTRGDLLERLKPEIERARKLYEERVPASITGSAQYFQQELVQTLAGGDPSRLG
jgi:hypothetical protein